MPSEYKDTAATGCQHPDFAADVSVARITDGDGGDVTQFLAEVTVRCTACGGLFGFRGPCAGHSWNEPRCDLDALKIQLPLMSPAELVLAGPLPALHRGPLVYEVYPRESESPRA